MAGGGGAAEPSSEGTESSSWPGRSCPEMLQKMTLKERVGTPEHTSASKLELIKMKQ